MDIITIASPTGLQFFAKRIAGCIIFKKKEILLKFSSQNSFFRWKFIEKSCDRKK